MTKQQLVRIRIRHRPKTGESAKQRHEVAIETLLSASLANEAATESVILEFAEGDELDVGAAQLNSICRNGVNANAVYGPRFQDMPDVAMYDDSLTIVCDTQLVDYVSLLTTSLPIVISTFGAYRANVVVSNEQDMIDYKMLNELRRSDPRDLDGRDGILRLSPACYFDRTLCERAFRLSCEVAAARLKQVAEHVELWEDGVLVVLSASSRDNEYLERVNRIAINVLK
ncbi:hypothetical protein NA78x_002550 [Anatilimnocola sp. NA78]|uniref:hypothetical protein n=1 Tax=Anatilimnocola sp. NA78 TaxID=3415683 RepID=UPI003CE501DC